MRIGLVEFILILFIASVTVGPQVALFVDRWLRRANRASALAARRKAEAQAQMAIEREALLHRFRAASNVFAALAAVALVYALVFRPIDTPPKTYAAPERAERAEHVRSVDPADALNLSAFAACMLCCTTIICTSMYCYFVPGKIHFIRHVMKFSL